MPLFGVLRLRSWRAVDALHDVSHHNEKSRPFGLGKLRHCGHDSCMNALFVWLPESHDENSAVFLVAVFRETLVRSNEHPVLRLGERPQLVIEQALLRCSAEVQHRMAGSAECLDGEIGDVFIDENFHLASTAASSGVISSSAREAA